MLSFILQEGENLTKEQIEDEIKKLKDAHAEDEGIYLFSRLLNVVMGSLALASSDMMATRNMQDLWCKGLG